ncbi:(2,3-dihydroxybenzoyl)adenylate synthase [Actinomadura rupiterrae]|uniref:(2,3-dihydroxybenzoyl)adenylate synthase n=1 Tax=Actinomadura rupiterrae TaxID=559627 RepID=UPI0020A4DFA3|nr:AMP-binding protein [Actinomadura rupiterrae]MCP2336086.1 2,3-dihydroxybenzoate-AMP ligase [Actinomadura rupiterrae]
MSPKTSPRSADAVPWPAEFAARYYERGYWQGIPLGAHVQAAADATPDALCLVDGDVRLTYRELMSRADGAALRLRDLGLRPGDRVLTQLPNCWEFVVLALACLRLGTPPLLALPAARRHEVTAIAEAAGARALVVTADDRGFDLEAMAWQVAGDVPSVKNVLVAGGTSGRSADLGELCAPAEDAKAARAELDHAAPDAERTALFLLSGGTTALPKIIARTHNDYAYMVERSADVSGFGPDTVYLAVLPLAHGFPMTSALGALMSGGRLVLGASPAPERAFADVERERVTATSLVPAVLRRWVEHRERDARHDLGSLELLQTGGASMPAGLARKVRTVLGCTLQQGYGMSEGLLCYTRRDDPEEVRIATQGRPVCPDDELLVVDAEGVPVPPGEPGLLLTRGPYTVRGYVGGGEAEARAFAPGGWYRTGDIVRLRPDGNLVVEGRDKDVVNRGGEKIAAAEVEAHALRLDGVAAAAVVPVPDDELGERVCLCVVLRPGRALGLDEVRAAMEREGVARYKLPERLEVLPDIPLTSLGKTDKRALRNTLGI